MTVDAGTSADFGSVLHERADGVWRLVLDGAWTVAAAAPIDKALQALPTPSEQRATIDLSRVSMLDTTGAWLVWRTLSNLRELGVEAELVSAKPSHAALIDTVARNAVPCPEPPRRRNALIAMIERMGGATFLVIDEGLSLLNFLGHVMIVFGRSLIRPHRIRFTPLISHIEQSGLNAIPIVGLISFLIGVVLAFQGAEQLARFGVEIFTVDIVANGVLREMGVLLTAIMLAGRSGSAFTAQIGTMKVNEEVDAMRTIGLDPMEILVLPRLWALVICLPLLTFFANVMGLLGGAIMATTALDITFFQFARQLSSAVTLWTFWIGIIKAPVFGFIIGMVGCYEGLRVSGSAESVGRLTTRAVVESIFLVIVLDAMFSILFAELGI